MNATRADWKAYLDWQGEMGTEEVVLAAPMIYRPVAGMTGAVKTGTSATRTEAQNSPGQNSTTSPYVTEGPEDFGNSLSPAAAGLGGYAGASIGPEFFTDIAAKLAKPEVRGRNKSAATPAPTGSASASTNPAANLPAFEDLEAYWTWVAAEYARLFPAVKGPIVRAIGHAAPRLAVVELAPSAAGLFGGDSGASGVLLDKMMTAIGLRREDLYLTSVMKTPPPGSASKAWARKDVARMLPALFRELKMAQCGLVLVLGEACAQAVLRTGNAIPEMTGKAVEAEGLSLSATWHPDEIRAEVPAADATQQNARPLSREAWTHLQWLRGRLPARGS